MDMLKLMTDAKDRELAAKDSLLAAKDREIALTLEARDARERALQLEIEQQRRENEQLKCAHAKELEGLRGCSLGSLKSAMEEALREDRVRLAREAAAAQYSQDQRSLWLRSPDCLLQVLCLVAFNGHPAWNFASLSRAFRGDELLWGCIKDKGGPGPSEGTYLTACSHFGDLARVRWLLDMGADVNHSSTDFGMTSLIQACLGGHLEIVRELLGRGANVAACTDYGTTSLITACRQGHLDIVHELLGRGADVNAANTDGWTSLMHACLSGHLEVVRELLGQGANVNAAVADDGQTSLMLACENGHLEVARLLLAHHASKTAVSNSGQTAYDYTEAINAELRALAQP